MQQTMNTVTVHGGKPLIGTVTPVANKNSILAALPASILSNEIITYVNVPNTTDVAKMLEMLRLLGADVDDSDSNNIKINCSKLSNYKVDKDLGNLIRASIMFAGPLLARFGIAEIPVPGGCVLGKRSIASHVDVFKKAGVKVEFFDGFVRFTAPNNPRKPLPKIDIWQFEASVTATENFLMYAAGVDGEFTLTDAACEPHVADLLHMLSDMGANINGINSNKIWIKGAKNLKGVTFVPSPDFVDISGYIVAAAITKGKIRIKGANIESIIGGIIEIFHKFNIKIERDKEDLVVYGSNNLKIDAKNSGFPVANEDMPKLVPRPWPGFPVDVLPVMVTLASKTEGRILIQNWMYETGLDFIHELNSMGANIFMCDQQRVIVSGPVKFKGGNVTSPGIIQACKAIFLASLADDVETVITGVDILKRRYPNVFEIYKSLGADISI